VKKNRIEKQAIRGKQTDDRTEYLTPHSDLLATSPPVTTYHQATRYNDAPTGIKEYTAKSANNLFGINLPR
jgi:hypothetical protein